MNSIDPDIEIVAKRIILRPVSMKYKKLICREFTTQVTKYMPFTPNGDITVTEDFIKNSRQELLDQTSLQLCILLKNNHEFLGCCGLHNLRTPAIEIGLWLKQFVHGKGYGFETVEALVQWTGKHFDFDYLLYPVDIENLASRRIPEKLGFTAIRSYVKAKSETENLNIIEYQKSKKDLIQV